ncbi:MAG TPA: SRPBCC family protein [Mycobacteriales bacterium]|nr:SRPBCC family protein [Mycobacteriales bacterium]
MHDEVSAVVDAPPQVVFALVSDIRRIGEFSPETFEAEWLDGADGPAAGARFRGHVKRNGRGPVYWTNCTVTSYEPDREFAFTVDFAGSPVNTWGYRLRPDGQKTVLTEWFRLRPTLLNRLYWAAAGRWRGRTNRRGMAETIARIKAVAEAGGRG